MDFDREIAGRICDRFGLGRAVRWALLGGTRNRNFLLVSTEGTWHVRLRYAGYCAPERIDFDHRVLTHLCEAGAPVVAPRLCGGLPCWRDQDRVWEVYPFIEGRHPRNGDPGDIAAVASALAQFHESGRRFPDRLDKLGPRGETDPRVLLEQADRIERDSPDCTGAVTRYRQWIESARARLTDEGFGSLPHTLVHGDVQPANALITDDGTVVFVDLDWCAWRPRMYDLAFALLFCCARRAGPIRGEDIWSLTQPARLRIGKARRFLDGYARRAGGLSDAELDALRPQMTLSWCHCRLAGALKVAPRDRRAFLMRAPRTLSSLFSSRAGEPAIRIGRTDRV